MRRDSKRFASTVSAHDITRDDILLTSLGLPFGEGDGEPADEVIGLLRDWRNELHAADMLPVPPPDVSPAQADSRPPHGLPRRTRRAAAVAAVSLGAALAMTGVAAAVTGPSGFLGPVHTLLFGHPAAPAGNDMAARLAVERLDQVAASLARARQAGNLTADERKRITALLDDATGLAHQGTAAPKALLERIAALRRELADRPRMPSPASPAATGRHDTHGPSATTVPGRRPAGGPPATPVARPDHAGGAGTHAGEDMPSPGGSVAVAPTPAVAPSDSSGSVPEEHSPDPVNPQPPAATPPAQLPPGLQSSGGNGENAGGHQPNDGRGD